MPTESELRAALREQNPTRQTLDADTVIREARGRRMPKKVAFASVLTSVATVAVVGIAIVGFTAFPTPHSAMTAAHDSAGDAKSTVPVPAEGFQFREPSANTSNLCGGALAEVAQNSSGLELATHFPQSLPANGQPVTATVTMTNTGGAPVTGSTAASPTIVVSRAGHVLWHSNGAMIDVAVLVDLAPGQSMDYEATFTPVACSPKDELEGGFPEGLPALSAGQYQISALIDFTPEEPAGSGDASAQLVTGPQQNIQLK